MQEQASCLKFKHPGPFFPVITPFSFLKLPLQLFNPRAASPRHRVLHRQPCCVTGGCFWGISSEQRLGSAVASHCQMSIEMQLPHPHFLLEEKKEHTKPAQTNEACKCSFLNNSVHAFQPQRFETPRHLRTSGVLALGFPPPLQAELRKKLFGTDAQEG